MAQFLLIHKSQIYTPFNLFDLGGITSLIPILTGQTNFSVKNLLLTNWIDHAVAFKQLMTTSILVNCYEDFELRFSLYKISLCKELTGKKKKKLYKWCILVFNTHRKKAVTKVLTFSHLIFLANQTQTSLIYCCCLSLYDCLLQFLITYRFFGLRYIHAKLLDISMLNC